MLSVPIWTKKFLTNFKFHISNFSQGFTLIELLVVIAIIGFLTGGAIVAYNNFNQGQVVRRAALELKTDLRESQTRAVSGSKHQDCRVDNIPDDNIDDYNLAGHYVVFDISGAGDPAVYTRVEACAEATNSGQDPTPDDITPSTETVSFSSPVEITALETLDSGGGACAGSVSDQLTINFEPLRGIAFYDGVDILTGSEEPAACVKARITIWDTTDSYAIEIDKSGQIFEEEVP